jgi:hypothetical protein
MATGRPISASGGVFRIADVEAFEAGREIGK